MTFARQVASLDLLTGDQAAGVWADPDRVRPIGHLGEFFDVKAALGLPRSRQGRPVLREHLDLPSANDIRTGKAS